MPPNSSSGGATILLIFIVMATGVLGAVQIYTQRDWAADKQTIVELQNKLTQCEDNSTRLKQMEAVLTNKDTEIANLKLALTTKDQEIARLSGLLTTANISLDEKDQTISTLSTTNTQLQQRVGELEYLLALELSKPAPSCPVQPVEHPTSQEIVSGVIVIAILTELLTLFAAACVAYRRKSRPAVPPAQPQSGRDPDAVLILVPRHKVAEVVSLLRKNV
jgi:hypothetical protein